MFRPRYDSKANIEILWFVIPFRLSLLIYFLRWVNRPVNRKQKNRKAENKRNIRNSTAGQAPGNCLLFCRIVRRTMFTDDESILFCHEYLKGVFQNNGPKLHWDVDELLNGILIYIFNYLIHSEFTKFVIVFMLATVLITRSNYNNNLF